MGAFLCFTALVLASILLVFSISNTGSGTTFTCITHGAALLQSTKDNGLHVTIWCVKNGRVVP